MRRKSLEIIILMHLFCGLTCKMKDKGKSAHITTKTCIIHLNLLSVTISSYYTNPKH